VRQKLSSDKEYVPSWAKPLDKYRAFGRPSRATIVDSRLRRCTDCDSIITQPGVTLCLICAFGMEGEF